MTMKTLLSLFATLQPSSSFQKICLTGHPHSLIQKTRPSYLPPFSRLLHQPSLQMSTSTNTSNKKALVVDPFCFRQFAEHDTSDSYGGTVFSISLDEFETIVNSQYDETKLENGYAPFCKHLFIKNDFTDAKVNVLEITKENESFLRTSYEARNDMELPVLTRSFPKELISSDLPVAQYLDLILYSREQIRKENKAMSKGKTYTREQDETPWGIVSIKAQNVNYEIPMTPITAMRNALGKEEGGSGVSLDRETYMAAYEYWNKHATIS